MSHRAMSADRLGISEVTESQYETMREIRGYRYETPPGLGYSTKDALSRFIKFAGAANPKFSPEAFDLCREKIQVLDKNERKMTLEAFGVLYAAKCGQHFVRNKNVDHAEFERMFNPNYAPKYADALRALDLPKKLWWKLERYETLENLSRLVLTQCDIDGKTEMAFEDWYQLFWNYAMPFNPVAYYCLIMGQQMVYTKEFVEELATYLKQRLETDLPHDGQPVLHYGARLGKLAKLINDTKICPVPVISATDEPTRNPYVISIPPHCQKKFAIAPNEKLKLDTAIEKYKPAIVLLSEMKTQQDITQDVRAHGCVKEYLTLGMPNTVIEGHGWDTFGQLRFTEEKDRGKKTLPPHMRDGWKKWPLHNVSRWAIHRNDQKLAMGCSAAFSFHRAAYTFDLSRRRQWFARRLVTFF